MNSLHFRGTLTVAVSLALIGLTTWAHTEQTKFWPSEPSSPSRSQRSQAITLVRKINTAEISYSSTAGHGRFGSWDELNQSGALKDAEVMPGWHLDLLVPADGKSWSIGLHDQREGDGLFSVFSDASGIIYIGAPLQ
jgi:hypothetical protein